MNGPGQAVVAVAPEGGGHPSWERTSPRAVGCRPGRRGSSPLRRWPHEGESGVRGLVDAGERVSAAWPGPGTRSGVPRADHTPRTGRGTPSMLPRTSVNRRAAGPDPFEPDSRTRASGASRREGGSGTGCRWRSGARSAPMVRVPRLCQWRWDRGAARRQGCPGGYRVAAHQAPVFPPPGRIDPMTAHARPGSWPGRRPVGSERGRNGRAVADTERTVESVRADMAQIKERAHR